MTCKKDGKIPVFENGAWVNKENNIGKFRVIDEKISEIKELGSFDYILTDKQLKEIYSGKLVKIENLKIVIYEKEKTTKEQIQALEAQQTPRRMRGAIAGNAESIAFLADIEKQIEKLRGAV